jgi:transcriptional regulator with XRE-family HTH domain
MRPAAHIWWVDQIKRAKKRLGRRIKQLRADQLKFSQEELAERLGVSPVYISRLERGASSPSFQLLVRVAGALHVSLSELLEEV